MSRGWLIDTNIASEWVEPRPDVGVVRWLDEVDVDRIFLRVIRLAEIRFGVERLAPGRRRTRLDAWLHLELPARFEKRIVPVDEEVADACGRLLTRAIGRPRARRDERLDRRRLPGVRSRPCHPQSRRF